jgi:hypothetical protein
METSKTSTGDEYNVLTSFAEAIHASLSAKQANDEAKTTQDTCGRGSEKRLASYDPDTQSWKMYGDTSLWGEPQSLESLPLSGMTQSGVLYQQPAWEPITGEIESSLWPTPTASDSWTLTLKSSQIKEGSRHSVTLPVAAGGQLNPTWVEWLMGFPTGWTDLEA